MVGRILGCPARRGEDALGDTAVNQRRESLSLELGAGGEKRPRVGRIIACRSSHSIAISPLSRVRASCFAGAAAAKNRGVAPTVCGLVVSSAAVR